MFVLGNFFVKMSPALFKVKIFLWEETNCFFMLEIPKVISFLASIMIRNILKF